MGKYLSKEDLGYIRSQIQSRGITAKSKCHAYIIDSLTAEAEQDIKDRALDQYATRVINSIAYSIRDEQGYRTAFLLRDEDTIVNLDKCTDLGMINRVLDRLRRQLAGIQNSARKAERRYEEVEGQMSLFAEQ